MSSDMVSGAVGAASAIGPLTSRSRRWLVPVFYFFLLVATLFPVLSVEVPGLVDYPNHLARAHILTEIDQNPLLAERYAVNWSVIPNLAMDAMLPPLARVLSVFDAGRVFLALTIILLLAGTAALHRAVHGFVGLWPAVSVLFVYNYVLAWGFLNYLFGVGICLLAFAGWIASRHWTTAIRIAVFSLVSTALFFTHIFALGIFGLSVMSYETWRCLQHRPIALGAVAWRLTIAGLQFVIPAGLWLMSAVGSSAGVTIYGSMYRKLVAVLSPALFQWQIADIPIFLFAAFVLLACLITRRISFARELRGPMIALGVAAVLMPNWLLGGWGADFRLPIVLALMGIAASRPRFPNWAMPICLALAFSLYGYRLVLVTQHWRNFDQQVAEFRAASTVMEDGARLLVLQERPKDDGFDGPLFYQIYWNLPALAVIDRSIFLPTLFTDPEKQPIMSTPAYRHIDTPHGTPLNIAKLREGAAPDSGARLAGQIDEKGQHVYWGNWPAKFDYVLWVRFTPRENPMPEMLDPVRRGSFFEIYRIVK